jgi:hypothetical protein
LGSIGEGIELIVGSDGDTGIGVEVLELVLEVYLGIGGIW